MTSLTLIWILCGLLALLVGMVVVLVVARSLDGSQADKQQALAQKLSELAQKAARDGNTGNASSWTSGVFAQAISSLAASAQGDDDQKAKTPDSDSQKQTKALFTGLAIAGGIIMLIVGIVTGDGS